MDKQAVHNLVLQRIEEKIRRARSLLESAQKSASEDTKSSAGDKFETGREMAKQEEEKAAAQLAQMRLMKQAFEMLDPALNLDKVQNGAFVKASGNYFYVGAALGEMKTDQGVCFVISTEAPLGQKLLGKCVGESVEFNGKLWKIEELS